MRKYTIYLNETLIAELRKIHNSEYVNIEKILFKALHEYIDRKKSNENYVVSEGIRYPIPRRVP
jgi:hypothetical protein